MSHSLYHPSVAFLLSSLGSSHAEGSHTREAGTLSASFQQPLAAARLSSRGSLESVGCPGVLFLQAQSGVHLQARLCPPPAWSWMPSHPDAPANISTFPEESEAANLFPFCSAPLRGCCCCSLQTGGGGGSARQSLPTLGLLILIITMRAAGNRGIEWGLSREAALGRQQS